MHANMYQRLSIEGKQDWKRFQYSLQSDDRLVTVVSGTGAYSLPPNSILQFCFHSITWQQVLKRWGETRVECLLVLSRINMISLIFKCQKKIQKCWARLAITVVGQTLESQSFSKYKSRFFFFPCLLFLSPSQLFSHQTLLSPTQQQAELFLFLFQEVLATDFKL